MTYSDEEIASLVEPARLHRSIYTDPTVFELEMERIWGGAWIFIVFVCFVFLCVFFYFSFFLFLFLVLFSGVCVG